MRAYAIFDGGGVKGAALAGCLSAAEEQGIEFLGFGGTSAGAIVSLLASVGYSGMEIQDLLLGDLRPESAFEDEGNKLLALRTHQEKLLQIVDGRGSWFTKVVKALKLLKRSRSAVSLLWNEGGVYDGKTLADKLRHLVVKKIPELGKRSAISFRDLDEHGATLLKIVAADLTSHCAAVFSSDSSTYGDSAIGAAVASASYPFVFKPMKVLGNSYLTDGGLASNLPVFLFAREHRTTKSPIFAFDIVSEESPRGGTEFPDLCGLLLSTALEAGDALLAESIPGVHRIAVSTPPDISTLKIDLSEAEISSLFDSGFRAATQFLAKFGPLANTKRAGELLKRRLWAIYGPPAEYQPVLWAFSKMFEEKTKAKGLRAHIMLPTGRGTRIVAYCYGQRDVDADTDLELDELGGCTGRSIEAASIVVADLEAVKANTHQWGITSEQQSRIPTDRRSLISIPIFSEQEPVAGKRRRALATLSIDSSTRLEETGWAVVRQDPDNAERVDVSRAVLDIAQEWTLLISRLLYSFR